MGFAVMSMTQEAADRVKAIVGGAGPDAKGIRVGIKKGGCAGMEYTIDMVTEPNPKMRRLRISMPHRMTNGASTMTGQLTSLPPSGCAL